jgi:hypothetical protein
VSEQEVKSDESFTWPPAGLLRGEYAPLRYGAVIFPDHVVAPSGTACWRSRRVQARRALLRRSFR